MNNLLLYFSIKKEPIKAMALPTAPIKNPFPSLQVHVPKRDMEP